MPLTKEDIIKAYKISKAIQQRIDITKKTNIRSTDVFPYLVKKGLFEPDRHNGVYFRKFLHKLDRHGELESLIPQCSKIRPTENEIFSEWYFHNAKDKMPKSKVITDNSNKSSKYKSTVNKNKMDFEEAVDIIKMLIDGINPITERPQDDLGVCTDISVIEALKTLIDPKVNKTFLKKESTQKPSYIKSQERLNKQVFEKKNNEKTYYSGTGLGKLKGKTYDEVIDIMAEKNYVLFRSQITYLGYQNGLKYKQNSKKEKWIVYPESLKDLLD
jgi:hypothetical protein